MTQLQMQMLNRRYRSEFQFFALTLTRDEDRARDLLQEVSYLVLKHRANFRDGTNFVAWVKTIIRNTFISDYRQRKRRRSLVERDRPTGPWLGDQVVQNPAEQRMGVEEIMKLIHNLPNDYRRAFVLHLHGNKYREIAQITGVPVGTAKSRVFSARRLLKEQLRRLGVEASR